MIQIYFTFLKNIASASYLVREFRLLREFIGVGRGFIRFAIKFIDDSELHVFEHIDSTLHKTDYSYHWQDREKNMIARWDNSPHHPEVATFPHHMHIKETVRAIKEPTFPDVLKKVGSSLGD